MNDILPADTPSWQFLETCVARVLQSYGYHEIRLPIVEQSSVFSRSIGDTTDIVQKEMYTFEDRNGDSLTLRPEGTAGCVRAGLQHGLFQQLPQRLWYIGPMFRHERPQRGRHRQFHQVGVEVFGAQGPDVDIELLQLTARLWRELGLEGLVLEINSLGSTESRARYRQILASYWRENIARLDDDSRLRLERNPLRILDSKNPELADLIHQAPVMSEHLDPESADHLETICTALRSADIQFSINPRLVRGLDYYSRTVFEWKTNELGAQGTVCAGGRYDGLVEVMGGKPLPAIGFAMGLERLLELLSSSEHSPKHVPAAMYVMATSDDFDGNALALSERLRDQGTGWSVVTHIGGGSMKSRMKKADRSTAEVAVILGEDELEQGRVTVKFLRRDLPQQSCLEAELFETIERALRPLSPDTSAAVSGRT